MTEKVNRIGQREQSWMGLQMELELAHRSLEAKSLLVVSSPALAEQSWPEEQMKSLAQPSWCHRPMVGPSHRLDGRPGPSQWSLVDQLG